MRSKAIRVEHQPGQEQLVDQGLGQPVGKDIEVGKVRESGGHDLNDIRVRHPDLVGRTKGHPGLGERRVGTAADARGVTEQAMAEDHRARLFRVRSDGDLRNNAFHVRCVVAVSGRYLILVQVHGATRTATRFKETRHLESPLDLSSDLGILDRREGLNAVDRELGRVTLNDLIAQIRVAQFREGPVPHAKCLL